MRSKIYKWGKVRVFLLFLLAFLCSGANTSNMISGKIFTLPVAGEEEPPLTPVSSMPVVFNESNEHTALSGADGSYNINVTSLTGSLYILRLDDNLSVGDLVVHDDVYLTSYTVPTIYGGSISDHNVMVFTPQQLTGLGVSLTSGKGALLVLVMDSDTGGFITGATAIVRNMNGASVGAVKYLAIDSSQPLGIILKNSPDSSTPENGGTIGFIAYNIDPGLVMVSGTKSGYSFIWRPAFIYANSITSGVSYYDCIFGAQGSYIIDEIVAYLVDEEGKPVSGATVTLCGMNKSATTSSDGSFKLTNIPYPAIVYVRARKTGYKDTYSFAIIEESEEGVQFSGLQDGTQSIMIFSNTYTQQLGLDFTGGGVIAGRIEDMGENPVKNAKVYVWDEYGDTPALLARYMDCMMETIDEDLIRTSDSGVFVVDTLTQEPVSLGISPARPVYLKFEHENTNGDTYYLSPHYIAPVFNNGITLIADMEMDRYIGKIEVSEGERQPTTMVVEPGATGVDLFYIKIEVPNSEAYPTPYLKSLTLKCGGSVLPTAVALYKKNGEDWDFVPCTGSYGTKIVMNLTSPIPLPAELLLRGNFGIDDDSLSALSAPYFYCELEKNCDMVVTADLLMGFTSTIYVSVDGAPVRGNKVYVKTSEPSVAVNPEQLNFGEVSVGQSETLTLTIINTSSVIVRVTPSISGTNANEFSVPSMSFDINVGEIGYVNVTFSPNSVGKKSAILYLTIGMGTEEVVSVPLAGTGVSGGGDDTGDGGGGGCFIATAAFGSPLHPYVNILRNFRDNILLKSKAGKSFVRWYYLHSPAVAKVIEKSVTLKIFTRILLIPVIGIAWLIIKGILSYLILGLAITGLLRMQR
ncbi:MAG: choice-of-anchor D domain-containing protein [bacterium]|nr:choice-of-anchor D domain-containing protein [bacterium]